MDRDGRTAKLRSWTDDDDDAGGAPGFDPAAVLRAIEDEEDEAPAARPAPRGADDFGAALRAALDYEAEAEDEAEAEVADALGNDHEDDFDDDFEDGFEDDYEEDHGDLTAAAEGQGVAPAAEPDADEAGAWDAEQDDDAGDWHPGDLEDAEPDDLPGNGDAAPAVAAFPRIDELDLPGRKPRIALMGEFSAGKSTLSNLLIGSAALPMKVTATQLPPVWISWGEGQPYREDIEGETHPVDISRLSGIDPAETRVIRLFAKSEVLEACDIIDMPGISDPNMASEVWERVIGRADAVIWCTHATQAWRQTEASVWESLDPKLFARSLLLITRFDKLLTETDRARVLRRVERETEGLFADRLPISLTRALAAGDDPELLKSSGAAAFRARFLEILDRLAGEIGSAPRRDRMQETLTRDGLVAPLGAQRAEAGAPGDRILPRRVRPVSQGAPARR